MAPLKQPDSLYNLACNSCISLLVDSFSSINQRHGKYGTKGSVEAVQDLQAFLSSTVPGIIWNDLFQRLLSSKPPLLDREKDVGQTGMFLYVNEFQKLAYALFAHQKLTSIAFVDNYKPPGKLTGGCMPSQHLKYQQRRKGMQFWERIFMNSNQVKNIVFPFVQNELDLAKILKLIGEQCQHLEKICFSRRWHSSTVLSIKEAALLLKCTKLRRIEECYEHGNPKIYKHVLDSLPELEWFSDNELVSCFPYLEEGRVLKLTDLEVDEKFSTPDNIVLVARVCPKLKCLKICRPTQSVERCSANFDALANSTLNLTSLFVVSDFPSSNHFQHLFSSKGDHLWKLHLHCSDGSIDFKSLEIIGKNCLNLQFLYIEQTFWDSDSFDHPTVSDMLIDQQSPVFKKLHNLKLETFDNGDDTDSWDPRVMKWLVMHATNVDTLALCQRHFSHHPKLNAVDFLDMFAVERLAELVNVKLRLGSLSRKMIQCVYDNCPKMRQLDIDFWSIDFDAKDYVGALKQHIARNNIDLTIIY